MARLSTGASLSPRFAIYCGAGVYVKAARLANNQPLIETGPVAHALAASRGVAVGVLHAARRAGLQAWLVQHPGSDYSLRWVAA